MRITLLIAFCSVLFCSKKVSAEAENVLKRGLFPFMAFIYYPDDTVVDSTGARFIHDAILIKPDWLISSAIDHSVLDNDPLGFPRKTLLARAGAVAIQVNLPLNEDEDEQEREIITIIRPSTHNVEVWWLTDITLLKTLLPFNMTPAVGVTSVSHKREYVDKNCVILVYAKRYGNTTDEKILMQFAVDLLPASIEYCGNQFSSKTMTCAVDSDETKNSVYEADFCQGNSGGPLLCEGEVMALQTYIENYCKQPHLYQLLSAWSTLITCSIEDKCNSSECSDTCTVVHKDDIVSTTETTVILTDANSTISPSSPTLTEAKSETEGEETTETTSTKTTETSTEISDVPTETTTFITEETVPYETKKPETTTISEETTTTETTTSTIKSSPTVPLDAEMKQRAWPKEKLAEVGTNMEKEDWSPVVERQTQQYIVKSAANSNMCLSPSLVVAVYAIKHFFNFHISRESL